LGVASVRRRPSASRSGPQERWLPPCFGREYPVGKALSTRWIRPAGAWTTVRRASRSFSGEAFAAVSGFVMKTIWPLKSGRGRHTGTAALTSCPNSTPRVRVCTAIQKSVGWVAGARPLTNVLIADTRPPWRGEGVRTPAPAATTGVPEDFVIHG